MPRTWKPTHDSCLIERALRRAARPMHNAGRRTGPGFPASRLPGFPGCKGAALRSACARRGSRMRAAVVPGLCHDARRGLACVPRGGWCLKRPVWVGAQGVLECVIGVMREAPSVGGCVCMRGGGFRWRHAVVDDGGTAHESWVHGSRNVV